MKRLGTMTKEETRQIRQRNPRDDAIWISQIENRQVDIHSVQQWSEQVGVKLHCCKRLRLRLLNSLQGDQEQGLLIVEYLGQCQEGVVEVMLMPHWIEGPLYFEDDWQDQRSSGQSLCVQPGNL